MCGIAGIFSQFELSNESQIDIQQMINSLQHRGPNAKGSKLLHQNRLIFGHTRLSILDLSDNGLQPMMSASNRFTITFNGEIYNHLDLRAELSKYKDIHWNSSTDTETLLECIDFFGLENTLSKLTGMFAFGLWDSQAEKLYLCRDRFGEKPLYYGWVNKKFIFSSELKSFKAIKGFNNVISKIALSEYLECSFVPAPLCIYDQIFKLNPGSILEIKFKPPLEGFSQTPDEEINHRSLSITKWWRHDENVSNSADLSKHEAKTLIHEKLNKSIRQQLISDVPLGCLLSGGIDSSLVASIMQSNSINPINTYTIGFQNKEFDESSIAINSAQILGTKHHEIISSPEDAIRIAKKMPLIYDEPFADSSQIPTFLVSELASSSVTVALSGDGGDEIFGGYNRYIWGPKIFRTFNFYPDKVKKLILNMFNQFPEKAWKRALRFMPVKRPHEKVSKVLEAIGNSNDLQTFYQSLIAVSKNSNLLQDHNIHQGFLKNHLKEYSHQELQPSEQMMLYDALVYMSDDILCKVDRASMANSLEIRAPYLSHELYDAAWNLPIAYKINNGESKKILKDILSDYIPLSNFENKKSGFSIPLGEWLRGPLRDWGNNLIKNNRIIASHYLAMDQVQKIWDDHQSRQIENTDKLWNILIFLGWLENQ